MIALHNRVNSAALDNEEYKLYATESSELTSYYQSLVAQAPRKYYKHLPLMKENQLKQNKGLVRTSG